MSQAMKDALKAVRGMKDKPPFALYQGGDYLEIQRAGMGNLRMRHPNLHDRRLTAHIVEAANCHEKVIDLLSRALAFIEEERDRRSDGNAHYENNAVALAAEIGAFIETYEAGDA